jgi:hypothetical protein
VGIFFVGIKPLKHQLNNSCGQFFSQADICQTFEVHMIMALLENVTFVVSFHFVFFFGETRTMVADGRRRYGWFLRIVASEAWAL